MEKINCVRKSDGLKCEAFNYNGFDSEHFEWIRQNVNFYNAKNELVWKRGILYIRIKQEKYSIDVSVNLGDYVVSMDGVVEAYNYREFDEKFDIKG